MQRLQQEHGDVFDFFCNGHHVLQRSDRFWAGLSTDLVIEQVLMKNVKTAGGLTDGRGMGESQRTQWLLSMPACAELNIAMQELTGVSNCTSDQHKEATYTRQSRDEKDTLAILAYLNARSLFFTTDPSLRNIASGVAADCSVDVDKAKDIGRTILQSTLGKSVAHYTFKRKGQAVTMDARHLPKVDGDSIQADPQLLFQRLVTVAKKDTKKYARPIPLRAQ